MGREHMVTEHAVVRSSKSKKKTALVLSIDEKSQFQALDREQPVLLMMPGVPERRTRSYVRHGTTSLFAALDIASGFVIGKCYKRYRARALEVLKEIDAQVHEGLDIHIVMDNYATHNPARCPHIRQAARGRHPYLHRPEQQKPETLQMDQIRRPEFGFRQTLLPQSPADFMWRTLDSRD